MWPTCDFKAQLGCIVVFMYIYVRVCLKWKRIDAMIGSLEVALASVAIAVQNNIFSNTCSFHLLEPWYDPCMLNLLWGILLLRVSPYLSGNIVGEMLDARDAAPHPESDLFPLPHVLVPVLHGPRWVSRSGPPSRWPVWPGPMRRLML